MSEIATVILIIFFAIITAPVWLPLLYFVVIGLVVSVAGLAIVFVLWICGALKT